MFGKKRILALMAKSGKSVNHEQILKEATNFYFELYSLAEQTNNVPNSSNKIDILPAILIEVSMAIKVMKNGKASGEDKLIVDIFKEEAIEAIKILTELFNKYIT